MKPPKNLIRMIHRNAAAALIAISLKVEIAISSWDKICLSLLKATRIVYADLRADFPPGRLQIRDHLLSDTLGL